MITLSMTGLCPVWYLFCYGYRGILYNFNRILVCILNKWTLNATDYVSPRVKVDGNVGKSVSSTLVILVNILYVARIRQFCPDKRVNTPHAPTRTFHLGYNAFCESVVYTLEIIADHLWKRSLVNNLIAFDIFNILIRRFSTTVNEDVYFLMSHRNTTYKLINIMFDKPVDNKIN